ncbi:4Fe-4S binding protein [Candidatus Fermentibacterales bacterium]|nr:4Fe-4S binding protein [Candidatus Fermentibacterales bacterium]
MMPYASRSALLFAAGLALLTLASSCTGPSDTTQLYVDPELCIGCGKCEDVCPWDAIEVIDGEAVIDPARCTFCLRCVEECPQGAVY